MGGASQALNGSAREEQVAEFAAYLFRSLHMVREKDLGADWTIEVRPMYKNNRIVDARLRKWCRNEDEFLAHVMGIWDVERHVYVGINPRAGEVGTQEGTPYVVNALVDLDSKNGYSRKDRLEQVKTFPLEPALLIESSESNLQAVYGFSQPQETERVKPVVERLQERFVTDKVVDSSRLMRVPGTYNVKEEYGTPQKARLLSVGGSRHSALALSSHLPAPESASTEDVYENTGEKILCSGEARNTTIFTQSRSLAARGFDKDVIMAAMEKLNEKFPEPLGSKSGDETVESVVDNAYENYERGDLFVASQKGHRAGGSPNSQLPTLPSKSLGTKLGVSTSVDITEGITFRGMPSPGPREWVVDPLFPQSYPTSFYGEGGVAKSYLALHLAISIASPEMDTWMGFPILTTNVLYVDFELDPQEQLRRAQMIAKDLKLDDVPEGFIYLPALDVGGKMEALSAAYDICARIGVGLMTLDSYGFAMGGDTERSSEVQAFQAELDKFRAMGVALHILDHQSRMIKGEKYGQKQEFGSSYKRFWLRSSIQLSAEWDSNTVTVKFVPQKSNFGRKVDPFHVRLTFEGDSIQIRNVSEEEMPLNSLTDLDEVILVLDKLGKATTKELETKAGLGRKTIQNRLGEHSKPGASLRLFEVVGKDGKSKVYALTEKGKSRAAVLNSQIDSQANTGESWVLGEDEATPGNGDTGGW